MRILGMWTLRMAPVLLLVIGLACSKPDAAPLVSAVESGDAEAVRTLSADPDAVDGFSGDPVLMTAVERGQVDLVRALLNAGADPNAVDRTSGDPVLMTAAKQGQVDMVWVPTIRSWALTRGFALHPGTRNQYEIRYTRTQHRPASRHVNDHGRVSGTHKLAAVGARPPRPRRAGPGPRRRTLAGGSAGAGLRVGGEAQ